MLVSVKTENADNRILRHFLVWIIVLKVITIDDNFPFIPKRGSRSPMKRIANCTDPNRFYSL